MCILISSVFASPLLIQCECECLNVNYAFVCICLYFEICLRSQEISLASLESALISVTLSQGQLWGLWPPNPLPCPAHCRSLCSLWRNTIQWNKITPWWKCAIYDLASGVPAFRSLLLLCEPHLSRFYLFIYLILLTSLSKQKK